MKLNLRTLLGLLWVFTVSNVFGQEPSISYPTPQTFFVKRTINPVLPTSSNVGTTGYTDPAAFFAAVDAPESVSIDANGNLYTTNQSDTITKISPQGVVTSIRGGDEYNSNTFQAAVADASGNIYASDSFHKAIVEIFAGTNVVDTLAKGFTYATGLALDDAGNLYVSDYFNGTLTKVAPGGVKTVLSSTLLYPVGVMVDNLGYVYVADAGHNEVKKIPVNGGNPVIIGSGFNHPVSLGTDDDGDIFVVDGGNHAVKEIPGDGSAIETLATSPTPNIAITSDPQGIIYIAFTAGNEVEVSKPIGGYSIEPKLPAGLIINEKTGLITGKPTAASAAKDYTVTAYNDKGKGTAVINITVLPSSTVATLSSLKISSGTLTPAFASGTTTYTATPKVTQINATITVNGATVASGSASAAIALAIGYNTITIIVTASDGTTTDTYTITVLRPSNNAKLSAFKLSAGALSPVFNTNTTSYTRAVPYTTPSVTVTPTAAAAGGSIKVNGKAVASGSSSAAIALAVGNNTISTVVTAQDGITTVTYTVIVTRAAASTNDNLSTLVVSQGTLSPAFATGTTTYSCMETNATTSVSLTPTAQVTTSAITINGVKVTSGTAKVITLVVGSNMVNVVVTAQDGVTTKTYSVNIIRPSNNAKLSLLKISPGALSPVFKTDSTVYKTTEPYTVSTVTVTPTVAAAGATAKINGKAVASGTASTAIALAVGSNTITTVVTAQDGVTTDSYSITVTRIAASTNDNLSAFAVSAGTLSPAFAFNALNYSDMVSNGTTSITVTPTTQVTTSTVTVNGAAVTSGAASGAIPLVLGTNTITTIVTAQNGTTKKTYTLRVIRPSNNAKLSALALSSGTLAPVFNTNTTGYTASVTNATTSVTVTPTATAATATIKVNGTVVASKSPSGAIALSTGNNTITILVTAQDGVTTDTYTIVVTRAAAGVNQVYEPVSVERSLSEPQSQDDGILVHQGLSPNGDGINDVLMIDGIANYPDNKLQVMNRSGQLVFEAKNYDNSSKVFDGHSNKTGARQLPGTYFYSLDYIVNGVARHKTGFVVLKY